MGSGYNNITVPQATKDFFKESCYETHGELLARLFIAADPETLDEIRHETMKMESDELTLQAAIIHDKVDTLRENADLLKFPNGLENLTIDLDEFDDEVVSEARALVAEVQSDQQPAVTDGGEQ